MRQSGDVTSGPPRRPRTDARPGTAAPPAVPSTAMAYDEGLAERVRDVVGDDPGIEERKMFGGLAVLLHGHMACGVLGDELMVRVGPEAWEAALAQPHAREMDFTGRSMKGMVYVGGAGIAEDDDLAAWVERGLAFAGSLPPKR